MNEKALDDLASKLAIEALDSLCYEGQEDDVNVSVVDWSRSHDSIANAIKPVLRQHWLSEKWLKATYDSGV